MRQLDRTLAALLRTLALLCLVVIASACSTDKGDDTAAADTAVDSAGADTTGVADASDASVDLDANPADAEPSDSTTADVPSEDADPTDVATADSTDGVDGANDDAAIDGENGDVDSDADITGDADSTSDADNDGGEADTTPPKVCNFGEHTCIGAKLGTCGPFEDGWIESNCFPGLTCSKGECVPVSNNLVIVFDTSGSMTGKVNSCAASGQSWPTCDPNKGCTRMDVSKKVFTKALGKIDDQVTRMALLRFPQKLYYKTTGLSCTTGYYQGQSKLSTDQANQQAVDGAGANWFWDSVAETECVEFPTSSASTTKADMLKWLDGNEAMSAVGSCSAPTSTCTPTPGCAGTCCAGTCYVHTDPELRPNGGTPIGKTLFYVGEYLRNRVVIDGKTCKVDADCGNVNYACKDGLCKDPARSCRETIVVLLTDGGESNSVSNYFAPWVQAKRMAYGLGCQSDADCVGGSSDDPIVCKNNKCLPQFGITGYYCSAGGAPCLPGAASGEATFCAGTCTLDPRPTLTATAAVAKDNVLRSPDGKPFAVRVYVVDISGATDMKNSMSLAISGNGKLLGADAEDPEKFLAALDSVFDIKNAKVCGEQF